MQGDFGEKLSNLFQLLAQDILFPRSNYKWGFFFINFWSIWSWSFWWFQGLLYEVNLVPSKKCLTIGSRCIHKKRTDHKWLDRFTGKFFTLTKAGFFVQAWKILWKELANTKKIVQKTSFIGFLQTKCNNPCTKNGTIFQ